MAYSTDQQLDRRDLKAILQEIECLAAYYTPEWHPDSDEIGQALCKTYAGLLEDVIQKLNKIPNRNFIDFLNVIETKITPKHAAKVPITMVLNNGVSGNILVPSGTLISATATSEHGEITFSTDSDLLVTPSKIAKVFSVSQSRDGLDNVINDHTNDHNDGKSFVLFEENENIQSHILYIGHTDIFNTEMASAIILWINFDGSEQSVDETIMQTLSNPQLVRWEYNWKTDPKTGKEVGQAAKMDFYLDGTAIRLQKPKGKIEELVVNGVKSRWIRCRLKSIAANSDPNLTIAYRNALDCPAIKKLEISSEYVNPGNESLLLPDLVFRNDLPLSKGGLFYPFGKKPGISDIFYIASGEAFSKKGSTITIRFEFEQDVKTARDRDAEGKYQDLDISWEYWDGKGWSLLDIKLTPQAVILDLSFTCPADIEQFVVNGQKNYWVRARIASFPVGKTKVIQKDNAFEIDNGFLNMPPIFAKLYYSKGVGLPPQQCLVQNNLRYEDCLVENKDAIKPFKTLNFDFPSILIGFDKIIEDGPINLFFSLQENNSSYKKIQSVKCNYLVDGNQNELGILDKSDGLQRSGLIQIFFPEDFAKTTVFGHDLYWMSVMNTTNDSGLQSEKTTINGIFLNTVQSSHVVKITNELLGTSNYMPNQIFKLQNPPIFESEIQLLVNESKFVGVEERNVLLNNDKISNYYPKSPDTWVRWEEVERFSKSGSTDRHFVLDRAMGTIQFGDGMHGKIPPIVKDNIVINYMTGGGSAGNLKANELHSFKGSFPFVNKVFNPVDAGGGVEEEDVADSIKRGPQIIRHREQAVTAEDFEWIIKEKFPSIHKVKCFPSRGTDSKFSPGSIAIVLAPSSSSDRPVPGAKLLEEIKNYLKAHSSPVISDEQFHIAGPNYVRVSVLADVYPVLIDQAQTAEKKAVTSLNAFLHPLTGKRGQGWEFGRMVSVSDIYKLLEEIPEVDYVNNLSLIVEYQNNDGEYIQFILTSDDDLDYIKLDLHCLISNGDHDIKAKWGAS